jgi:hypothetical protein
VFRGVLDIFVLIVWLAITATVLASKNTSSVIGSISNLFTGSIKAAKAS